MNNGFIKLHRKFLEWEWYSNVNDRLVFIHCLLKANWEDGWYEGKKIPRGSFATSYKNLSKEIGISVRQLRTSLNHLKTTNNLTHESNHQFSIITINNYDKYQANDIPNDKRLTNERQTIDNNIRRIRKKENNNMNIIINNWDKNVQCDEIAKSTSERCFRRSSYNINGKNYCNQHSRNIIKELLNFKQNKNELPDWFDKDFVKQNENIDELEDVLKEFI